MIACAPGIIGAVRDVARAARVARAQVGGARRQQHQRRRVASVERQLDDLLLRYHLPKRAGARFDQCRLRFHGHRLGDVAHLKRRRAPLRSRPSRTVMLRCSKRRNPGASDRHVVRSDRDESGKTNPPSDAVDVSRLRPVAVFVASTRAFGTGASLESRTLTETVPVGSAARRGVSKADKMRRIQATVCRFITPP